MCHSPRWRPSSCASCRRPASGGTTSSRRTASGTGRASCASGPTRTRASARGARSGPPRGPTTSPCRSFSTQRERRAEHLQRRRPDPETLAGLPGDGAPIEAARGRARGPAVPDPAPAHPLLESIGAAAAPPGRRAVDGEERGDPARPEPAQEGVARLPVVGRIGGRGRVRRLLRRDLVPAEVVADDLDADLVESVEPLRERPGAVRDPRVVLEAVPDRRRSGRDRGRSEGGREHGEDECDPRDQAAEGTGRTLRRCKKTPEAELLPPPQDPPPAARGNLLA